MRNTYSRRRRKDCRARCWRWGSMASVIMVNRAEHLVIVQWSTWPQAEPSFNAQPLEACADVQRHCPRIALISLCLAA